MSKKAKFLELSANKSDGSVIAGATASDLGTQVFGIRGLFCCVSLGSRSESLKEKLVEKASGTGLQSFTLPPQPPPPLHHLGGTDIFVSAALWSF